MGQTKLKLLKSIPQMVICIDNSLILHIYIIVRKHYHTYFEVIHAFHIWFWNNAK